HALRTMNNPLAPPGIWSGILNNTNNPFNPGGTVPMGSLRSIAYTWNTVQTDDFFWVTDTDNHCIWKSPDDGATWWGPWAPTGGLVKPTACSGDHIGNSLYVADSGARLLHFFDHGTLRWDENPPFPIAYPSSLGNVLSMCTDHSELQSGPVKLWL